MTEHEKDFQAHGFSFGHHDWEGAIVKICKCSLYFEF